MTQYRLLALVGILASAGCAAAPAPAAAPPAAPAPAERTLGAPTESQPASGGSIAGVVATNPWHDIKNGAVVYLEDGPRDAGTPASATLDNHDMMFVPNIVVVAAGGSVLFTNTDPLKHNVFTPDGEGWNLGLIPQNATVVKRFDTPGAYTILCNLHPHMIAYLVVTPSSHFARTDAAGAYAIANVPPGTYHVTAWSPRLKPLTQPVTVGSGEVTLNFDLGR